MWKIAMLPPPTIRDMRVFFQQVLAMDSMSQSQKEDLEESFSLYDTEGDQKIHLSMLGK